MEAEADVAAILERHRCTNLVVRSSAPRAATTSQKRSVAGALSSLALQRDILGIFRRAGIPSLVLKGIPLAAETARDPFARDSRDLDILVGPGDVVRASAALSAAGLIYMPARPWSAPLPDRVLADAAHLRGIKDVEFRRDGGIVELHWRLTANPRLLAVEPTWLTSPRHVDVAGDPVPVLPELVAWWHIHVHGTEHAWYRLKWVADVLALAWCKPEVLLTPSALRATEAAGLRRCVAVGLLVAEATFGPFLARAARDWARATPGTRPHVAAALAALAATDIPAPEHALGELPGYIRRRLTLRSDSAFKAEELRCLLVAAARSQERAEISPALVLAESARRVRQRSRTSPGR